MAESSIEWTDVTWNPVAGCTILSPGCTNCYAMRMAARLEAMGTDKYVGLTRKSGGRAVWTNQVNLDNKSLLQPAKWKKPRMVFVNSMSDLFHESVPDDFIAKVFDVMGENHRHTFQVLTKRSGRLIDFTKSYETIHPNVWLGVSVESSDYLERINHLRSSKAFIKFISFEPLIGSVKKANLKDIDWAIVGGESGPKARPIETEWVDEIKTACRRHNTAFFFKQWGGVNKKKTGRTYQGRTWDEYPAKYEEEYPRQFA